MKIFDDIGRNYDGPAKYAESEFAYLNRSATPLFHQVRNMLEDWFKNLPDDSKKDIRGRLRSQDDSHHNGAFFELFLHELLLNLGCNVEIHPLVDHTLRQPDFLVNAPNGEQFFMEAVVLTNKSEDEASGLARTNGIYDAIDDKLNTPDFYIGMRLRGYPSTSPPSKQIVRFLEERLSKLDYDKIAHTYKGNFNDIPCWLWSYQGWKIEFFPIPKPPKLRGVTGIRPIGFRYSGLWLWDIATALKDSIKKKGWKYGELNLPFVAAVNVLSRGGVDQEEVIEALYGKVHYLLDPNDEEPNLQPVRYPDGVWGSNSTPLYTRISSALITSRLTPWNLHDASICLYQNPWAKLPYKSVLTKLPQLIVQKPEGTFLPIEGESLSNILGIHF